MVPYTGMRGIPTVVPMVVGAILAIVAIFFNITIIVSSLPGNTYKSQHKVEHFCFSYLVTTVIGKGA